MGNSNEHNLRDSHTNDHNGFDISRRTMVAGTLATTVMLAVSPLSHAAEAVNVDLCDPNSQLEMVSFLVLSAALTGVSIQTLAPEFSRGSGDILSAVPGIDPFNIKDVYLTWI